MSLGARDSAQASHSRTSAANGDGSDNGSDNGSDEKPFFEVTAGNPTREEVGILAAVLATAEGNAIAAGDQPSGPRDYWGAYSDKLRSPYGYTPTSFHNSRS